MAWRLRLPEVRAWWRMGRRRWPVQKYEACGKRTSVTAGTLFDRRRTPLTVWFTACWMFAAQKDGVSALSLQRSLEIGSYPTAWAMLHRLRSVLVRPGRDRLTGTVEVDETFIGGEEAGLRGGQGPGQEVPGRRGRRGQAATRVRALPDGDLARRLGRLAAPLPHPPRRARGDGDHRRLDGLPRDRRARLHPCPAQPAARARGEDPGKLLPGVHRVASLAKRWLLGTHQGSVEDAHLQSYLNEFCFRFNRRWTPAAGGWSSTAYSNSPPGTIRCGTGTWSLTPSTRRSHPPRRASEATRRASSAHGWPGPGEPLTWHSPVS